jgi:PiT family inorganic phosphate transporter
LDIVLLIFIATALTFDFLNGFHDSANVSRHRDRLTGQRAAHCSGVVCYHHLIGPFLFGVAVATTIGSEVISEEAVTIPVAMAALSSAIIWNLVTWFFGIPSSSSHALIGGFVGAAVTGYGLSVLIPEGLIKVLLALFISPFLGLFFGWLGMSMVLTFGQFSSPKINQVFLKGQWITATTLGLSHGTNDAQKTMGILAMGLVAFGVIDTFYVPDWVIFACAASMALGTALGGWRLIKTMGFGFYKVRPSHAFSSQIASTVVILGAALLGGPVSTTQVISSSIVGAGAAERANKVRWELAGQIVMAWVITMPVTALLGGLFYLLLRNIV